MVTVIERKERGLVAIVHDHFHADDVLVEGNGPLKIGNHKAPVIDMGWSAHQT